MHVPDSGFCLAAPRRTSAQCNIAFTVEPAHVHEQPLPHEQRWTTRNAARDKLAPYSRDIRRRGISCGHSVVVDEHLLESRWMSATPSHVCVCCRAALIR